MNRTSVRNFNTTTKNREWVTRTNTTQRQERILLCTLHTFCLCNLSLRCYNNILQHKNWEIWIEIYFVIVLIVIFCFWWFLIFLFARAVLIFVLSLFVFEMMKSFVLTVKRSSLKLLVVEIDLVFLVCCFVVLEVIGIVCLEQFRFQQELDSLSIQVCRQLLVLWVTFNKFCLRILIVNVWMFGSMSMKRFLQWRQHTVDIRLESSLYEIIPHARFCLHHSISFHFIPWS
jgi:hypothetical protein